MSEAGELLTPFAVSSTTFILPSAMRLNNVYEVHYISLHANGNA